MRRSTLNQQISFITLHLMTFAALVGSQNQIVAVVTKTTGTAVASETPTATATATATTAVNFRFNAFVSTRNTSTLLVSPPLVSSSRPSASYERVENTRMSLLSSSFPPAAKLSSSSLVLPLSPLAALSTSTEAYSAYTTATRTTASSSERRSSSFMNNRSKSISSNSNFNVNPSNSYHISTSTGNSISKSSSSSQHVNNYRLTAALAAPSGATSSFKNVKTTSRSKFPLEFTYSRTHWTFTDAVNNSNFGKSPLSTASLSSTTTTTELPRIFRNNNRHHHEHHWGPFFEEPLNSTSSGDNIITTAHLFTEAILNCRVGMLKDKTVMWVRRTAEKVSLLTFGNVTYSSDPRIRVKFQYPNNWRLLINPTQWEDAGIYMCQVSTHPPRVFTTNLTVIEPPLRLIDEQERDVGDRYYKTGSTIDLQCQVSRSFLYKENQNILKSLMPLNANLSSFADINQIIKTNKDKSNLSHTKIGSALNALTSSTNQSDKQELSAEKLFSNIVFWAKDDEELPTTALRRISANEKWLTSRMSIPDAKFSDSGNYSCAIGRLFAAIVQVQVLTGELPAAVQHNSASDTYKGKNMEWKHIWEICLIYALFFPQIISSP
ncbi:defective proboscis extension response 18 [Glossina fuscipes fuscipes]